jgi:hypothetical protein
MANGSSFLEMSFEDCTGELAPSIGAKDPYPCVTLHLNPCLIDFIGLKCFGLFV